MITLIMLLCAAITVTVCGLQLIVALQRYRLEKPHYEPLTESDMPTVSVCIPARNETYALADCLHSVLASDYEKLEVIVYDDCSQDKTSNIIKSFAHDGVRFIQGEVPAEGWLGKNYACETLAAQANGAYILYMGVDVRIEPTTISQIMYYTRLKHASMVSVLPRRRDNGWRTSVFLSPLRYFIQMVVPQWIHTPASSAFWLVHRQQLQSAGGFEYVRNQIMPESTLARLFDKRGTYRYLISSDNLGVFYAKKWRSQIDTSIRLAYPALKKQLMYVLLVAAFMYLALVFPYIVVATAILNGNWDAAAFAAVGFITFYFLLYLLYARRVWRHGWLLGALAFPYLVLQEIALILTSMVAYLLGKVDWKGRNVCYPVMKRIK